MERSEGHLQRSGRQNCPKERKEEWTQLDVPRYIEDRGKQAKHENGRKLGRHKKTKWRNTKKELKRTKKTI
jgi:hypothetical protein